MLHLLLFYDFLILVESYTRLVQFFDDPTSFFNHRNASCW